MIKLSKQFINLKLNPEDEKEPKNRQLQQKYKVSGFPAVVFATPDGNMISNNPGYRPPVPFAELMKRTLEQQANFKKLVVMQRNDPKNLNLMVDLALLYIERENLGEAQPLIDQITQNDTKDQVGHLVIIYQALGLMYLSQGKIDSAESQLEEILSIEHSDTDLSSLYFQLGLYYGQNASNQPQPSEEYQKAIVFFETVVKKYPKSQVFEEAQLYIGISYELKGDRNQAKKVLGKLRNTAKNSEILNRVNSFLDRLNKLSQ